MLSSAEGSDEVSALQLLLLLLRNQTSLLSHMAAFCFGFLDSLAGCVM